MMENAARMCIDKVNSEGGINGNEIKTVFVNDHNDPELAVSKASAIAESKDDILVVIGHYFSSVSIPAGKVYQKAMIPAITGASTNPMVTKGRDWYFRTVATDSFQFRYAANYIHRILKPKRVMIIYGKDSYARSVRRNFRNEAKKLGIILTHDMHIDTRKNFQQHLGEISRALKEDTLIFLAMLNSDSAELVPALKQAGVNCSIFIADSFDDEQLNVFAESPREEGNPGRITNGIYTVTPVIFDIANRMARDFKLDYEKKYSEEPDWSAACTYDAVMVAMEAMRRADIKGKGYARRDRREIQRALSGMYSEATGAAGLQGVIYFDENGNFNSPPGIGVYHRGKLRAAMEQYQMVGEGALSKSLEQLHKEVVAGDVVIMDGRTMVKTDVVYAGLEINEISGLNVKPSGTFFTDFYLWFYFKKGFDDSSITFRNAVSPISLDKLFDKEKCVGKLCTSMYRVKGRFRFTPDFRDYPFDAQRLPVIYEHERLTRDKLIYMEDFLAAPLSKNGDKTVGDSIRLEDDFIWYIPEQDVRLSENVRSDRSSMGILQYRDNQKRIGRSGMEAEVMVKKKLWVLLHYLPAAVLLAILYTVHMFPADNIFARILIPGSALAAAFLFHMWLRLYLGIDYMACIERGPYLVYAAAALNLTVSAVAYRFLLKGRDAWVRMTNFAGAGIQTVVIAANVAIVILR